MKRLVLKSIQTLIIFIRLIADLTRAWCMQIRDVLTMRKKSIEGDVVVIIGGAGGIGSTLGQNLAICGAKIVLVDLNKEAVEKRVRVLEEKGWPVWSFCCDCTDERELKKLAHKIYDHPDLGRVDILINSAGAIKAFLPSMLERNKGHIVTLSSLAGYFGQSFTSAYSASKYAVRGIMESVHWEIHDCKRTGVKTTTLYPYITQTGLLNSCSPSSRFFDNLPVDYTVSHIVYYILYEYDEAFIPNAFTIFTLFLKATSIGHVKAVWRDFFDVNFFTGDHPPFLMNGKPMPSIARAVS